MPHDDTTAAATRAIAPLAILGGTFDPVHYGHLRMADEVRVALDLPQVRLVPAGIPPHRHPPQASAHDRIAMLELAVREFPDLVVDTREIARCGPSYTVDTLAELRREMPGRPIALLAGADAFRGLPSWHRWRALFDLAHLVVVPRPGSVPGGDLPPELAREWNARRTDDAQVLRSRLHGAIYVQPIAARPISSTGIRSALAHGAQPVEFAGLLPASVLAYIESNHLYSPSSHAS